MRRRALIRTFGMLGLLVVGGLAVLACLLRHEPAEYRDIPVPEGLERRKLSGDFSNGVQRLMDDIGSRADDRWKEEFTADQMNSYFEEDFIRVKPFKLPEGVRSPRVSIKPGRLRLAFRYGQDLWTSVVTVDLNIWLVANEANVVAVEVLDIRAGALPVSTQSMLEQVSENARRWNADVNWYRHEGHPVAVVRFQPDQPNPSVLLQRLELQDGRIVIEGKSAEPAPFRSMLSMADTHP
jgi:hypothetical protein